MTPSATVRPRLRFHGLAVTGIDTAAADGSAVAVTCGVPEHLRDVFAFRPGQHVTVRASVDGRPIRRCYSLCSTPAELSRHGVIRLGIRRMASGAFSAHRVGTLAVGDVLDVLPPVGTFGTAVAPGRRRHYGAIVAGSGITPVLSLVTTALATETASTFTVLYANRSVDSTMFAEDLSDLKDRYPRRLHLVDVFSRGHSQTGLTVTRLDAATLSTLFEGIVAAAAVQEWFLCGPIGLVQAARRTLLDRGVHRSAVHTELFGLGRRTSRPVVPARCPGTAGPEVRMLLDGRSSTVHMGTANSVLDAALVTRSETPYSCRTGVCGTCRARVTSGAVRMGSNWSLTEEELAAGYVLTCQAVPTTDQVTVDFGPT